MLPGGPPAGPRYPGPMRLFSDSMRRVAAANSNKGRAPMSASPKIVRPGGWSWRLSFGLVLGLAVPMLLVSPSGAQEAAPMCEGSVATIVGGPKPDAHSLIGTNGPDVIVTNGSGFVDAKAGDDLVCITGALGPNNKVRIDDGPGDDRIINQSKSTGGRQSLGLVSYFVGAGDDTIIGGPADESFALYSGADTVQAGAGLDSVTVSAVTTPEAFAGNIDLGREGGTATFERPMTADATLDGGDDGTSRLSVRGIDSAAGSESEWLVNNTSKTATLGGQELFHWSGIDSFSWDSKAPVNFVGSEDSETFGGTNVKSVNLAGGDDSAGVGYPEGAAGGAFDGGPGNDQLTVFGSDSGGEDYDVLVDLTAGTARYEGGPTQSFTTFESVKVSGGDDAMTKVLGTDGDDKLDVRGCIAEVRGGGGDDTIDAFVSDDECRPSIRAYGGPGDDNLRGGSLTTRLYGGPGDDILRGISALRGFGGEGDDHLFGGTNPYGPSRGDLIRGGPGNDVMFGYSGNDLLLGQEGQDTANGGPGRDKCSAESRRGCERD